jgi:hypothetical protein
MHHEPWMFAYNFIIPNIHILTGMRVIANLLLTEKQTIAQGEAEGNRLCQGEQ